MNVLFLDQFSELGGAQRCLLDLLPAIAERGGRMFAAVPSGPLVARLQESGVEVIEIPCGPYSSGSKSGIDAIRFAVDVARQKRILRGVVDRHHVDLIYANGPRIWPVAAELSRARIAAVFHAHNPIGHRLSRMVAGWSIRRANATVIACCESTAAPLRRFARDRLTVVPNGTSDLGYRARRFGQNGWRIGLIGRIAPEKGQLEFVQAAERLYALPPHPRFVICGAPMFADSRYSESVRRRARRLPVEFAGWSNDIGRTLAGLDLLVIASKQEAMPRVMLEAFSAGVPVVAFDVGGIAEVIKDEDTGFLAREATVAALAKRIADALADTDRLGAIAERARRSWERQYTIDHYRRGIMLELDRAMDRSQEAFETTPRPRYK